jgi:hypothetical protein
MSLTAISVSWDGCHKIYVAMDLEQYAWFQNNYEITFHGTPAEMGEKAREWYEDSCGLKFVNGVKSPGENDDFTDLIPQCWDPETQGWVE